MATARKQIFDMFHGQGFSPRFTVYEVMNATGFAESTCRSVLVKMYNKGLLQREKDGRGRWVYSRSGYSEFIHNPVTRARSLGRVEVTK